MIDPLAALEIELVRRRSPAPRRDGSATGGAGTRNSGACVGLPTGWGRWPTCTRTGGARSADGRC